MGADNNTLIRTGDEFVSNRRITTGWIKTWSTLSSLPMVGSQEWPPHAIFRGEEVMQHSLILTNAA
jgi:hypothetical protein